MRTMLLAAAFALTSLCISSEAEAQWGPTYPGGQYIGSAAYGAVTPQYAYGAGFYYGGPYATGVIAGGPPFYAGYGGYAPYGYRVYGRGRTFGGYQPRIYPNYQPRRFGLFDR